MRREALAPWLTLAVALSLVPVYAMDVVDVDRANQAQVVDPTGAYVGEESHDAVLNASNAYEDEAFTIHHQHVDDGTLRVWVNNTASDPRFVFPDDPLRLSAGTSGTVPVQDTDTAHEPGSFLVDARIETQLATADGPLGRGSMDRSLSVTVE